MGKALRDVSDAELAAEHKHWDDQIINAKQWGAAISAADEFRKDTAREIRRRAAANTPTPAPEPLDEAMWMAVNAYVQALRNNEEAGQTDHEETMMRGHQALAEAREKLKVLIASAPTLKRERDELLEALRLRIFGHDAECFCPQCEEDRALFNRIEGKS